MLIQIWQIVAGLLTTLIGGGAISTLIHYKVNKRKVKVDTDSIIVKNIMDWAVSLTQRIDKLEKALEEKERQIDELIRESHKKDLVINQLTLKVNKLEKNGNSGK